MLRSKSSVASKTRSTESKSSSVSTSQKDHIVSKGNSGGRESHHNEFQVENKVQSKPSENAAKLVDPITPNNRNASGEDSGQVLQRFMIQLPKMSEDMVSSSNVQTLAAQKVKREQQRQSKRAQSIKEIHMAPKQPVDDFDTTPTQPKRKAKREASKNISKRFKQETVEENGRAFSPIRSKQSQSSSFLDNFNEHKHDKFSSKPHKEGIHDIAKETNANQVTEARKPEPTKLEPYKALPENLLSKGATPEQIETFFQTIEYQEPKLKEVSSLNRDEWALMGQKVILEETELVKRAITARQTLCLRFNYITAAINQHASALEEIGKTLKEKASKISSYGKEITKII